jgi:hypothetical protein
MPDTDPHRDEGAAVGDTKSRCFAALSLTMRLKKQVLGCAQHDNAIKKAGASLRSA